MAFWLYLCMAFNGGSWVCTLPVFEEGEMDMKKMRPSHMHVRRKKRKKGDTDRLAAQLAPLEEQDKPAAEQQIGGHLNLNDGRAGRDYGAIVVDNENLKVPTDIMETPD